MEEIKLNIRNSHCQGLYSLRSFIISIMDNERRLSKIQPLIMILMILFSLVFLGCAQERLILTEQEKMFKNLGVKTSIKWNDDVVNQIRHYDEYGRLIEEKWQNPKGFVVTRRELIYDEVTGRRSKTLWYRADRALKSKQKFNYDERDRLIEERWLTPSDVIRTVTLYEYMNDKIASERKKNNRGHLLYNREYDYNDNYKELVEINAKGDISNRQLYKYDDEGQRVKEYWFNIEGKIITTKEYIYKDGLLVEEVHYEEDDQFKYRLIKKYKDNGLLDSESWHDQDGMIYFENQYTYEYY